MPAGSTSRVAEYARPSNAGERELRGDVVLDGGADPLPRLSTRSVEDDQGVVIGIADSRRPDSTAFRLADQRLPRLAASPRASVGRPPSRQFASPSPRSVVLPHGGSIAAHPRNRRRRAMPIPPCRGTSRCPETQRTAWRTPVRLACQSSPRASVAARRRWSAAHVGLVWRAVGTSSGPATISVQRRSGRGGRNLIRPRRRRRAARTLKSR